ncbi:MAG: imidazoleglycerol-phosphate dehydratase HisB [Elusimicrobia bacterium]|nr:imidazoleglycerol-phosphate dehydratase HisB [Candidatus Obscuribacterium magneticum]
MKRIASVHRVTRETNIRLKMNLDGKGRYRISTSIPFLDHMLELFSKHGLFDIDLKATGDTRIDDHHLVEDIGLTMGDALMKALGSKKGIQRYGYFLLPMDEAISYVAIDLSGRPCVEYEAPGFKPNWKTFDLDLLEDFFQALGTTAKMNLHLRLLKGRNNHHMVESLFKAFAKALAMAVSKNKRVKGIPSTKGRL